MKCGFVVKYWAISNLIVEDISLNDFSLGKIKFNSDPIDELTACLNEARTNFYEIL